VKVCAVTLANLAPFELSSETVFVCAPSFVWGGQSELSKHSLGEDQQFFIPLGEGKERKRERWKKEPHRNENPALDGARRGIVEAR